MKNILSIKKSVPYSSLVLLLLPAFTYSTDVITSVAMIALSIVFIFLSIFVLRFTEKYLSDYVSLPILFTMLGLFYFLSGLIPKSIIPNISQAAFASVFLALYEYKDIKQFFEYDKKIKLIKRHSFISLLLIITSAVLELLSSGSVASFKFFDISYPFFKSLPAVLLICAVILYIIDITLNRFINLKSVFQVKKGIVKFVLYIFAVTFLVNSFIYLINKFVLSPLSLGYLNSVLTFTVCGCIYPILKYVSKKISIGERAISTIPIFVLLISSYTFNPNLSFLNIIVNTLFVSVFLIITVVLLRIVFETISKKNTSCAHILISFLSVYLIAFDYLVSILKTL